VVYGQTVHEGAEPEPGGRRWAYLLLLLPLAAVIYPPLYNHRHPTLDGVPFFVWYQLLAVVFGGAVTGLVYVLRGKERALHE
jgi:hypothetical protein